MRIPNLPPPLDIGKYFEAAKDHDRFGRMMRSVNAAPLNRHYLHWDKLRRYTPPEGVTHEEWWFSLKMARMGTLKHIGLSDKKGRSFQFGVPEIVAEELHQIDLGAGGMISMPEQLNNPNTRDRYLMRSLMEEAITSSQLEGAVTTREVAKEMIRNGRAARNESEQMILNNYATMRRIGKLKSEPLSRDIVFQIHRMVTEKTLPDPSAAGRFRRSDEKRVVGDDFGEVYHDPPESHQLEQRMDAMCAFANGEKPDFFVHPAVRAIILHFWLAYDHPFVDGNGRTARALFYWAMLRSNYWLFEYISISTILRKAPVKYGRSFLYTETDENDLTYFIISQTQVIRRAIKELHDYISRKTTEMREVESHMRALDLFNHRQVDLIRHAMKHPGQRYTIQGHSTSHSIVYQTARADLVDLRDRGIFDLTKRGKLMLFVSPIDLCERMAQLEKKSRVLRSI